MVVKATLSSSERATLPSRRSMTADKPASLAAAASIT